MGKGINPESFKEGIIELDETTGFVIDEADNLLLNMNGGLLPEYLQHDECECLAKKYGEDWFDKLGYWEPAYKRPKF